MRAGCSGGPSGVRRRTEPGAAADRAGRGGGPSRARRQISPGTAISFESVGDFARFRTPGRSFEHNVRKRPIQRLLSTLGRFRAHESARNPSPPPPRYIYRAATALARRPPPSCRPISSPTCQRSPTDPEAAAETAAPVDRVPQDPCRARIRRVDRKTSRSVSATLTILRMFVRWRSSRRRPAVVGFRCALGPVTRRAEYSVPPAPRVWTAAAARSGRSHAAACRSPHSRTSLRPRR